MLGQHADVVTALAQRRHHEPHDVEAKAQVVAEAPGRGFIAQRPVGGRHDTHVDATRRVLADPPHLAFLQHAQQLGLRPR